MAQSRNPLGKDQGLARGVGPPARLGRGSVRTGSDLPGAKPAGECPNFFAPNFWGEGAGGGGGRGGGGGEEGRGGGGGAMRFLVVVLSFCCCSFFFGGGSLGVQVEARNLKGCLIIRAETPGSH